MPRRKKGVKGRGSVFPRKDGRWVAQFIVEETGKPKHLYASTEKEAYEKLDKALQEQKQGILATGPNQQLGDYLNWWLEDVHKVTIRKSSYIRYRSALDKHILPELGQIQLRRLSTRTIQAFYNKKLKEGQSPSSVLSLHKVLHGGLKRAVKLRYLPFNPSDGVSLPSGEPEREGQALTLEQARHILKVAHGHWLEAFIALALSTGLRHGELTSLRWSDIAYDQKMQVCILSVRHTVGYYPIYKFLEGDPKTRKGRRVIPLVPAVYKLLEEHRQNQDDARQEAGEKWKDQGLVFPNRHGDFLYPNIARATFYRLLDKARRTPDESGQLVPIPDIHIHDLRHTASTLWQSLGISEKMAQELLGHSEVEMTRNVYTHIIPAMQQEFVERLNSLF